MAYIVILYLYIKNYDQKKNENSGTYKILLDTYKNKESAIMEVVLLAKKFLFSFVIVFMSGFSGNSQLFILSVLNFTFAIIVIIMRPYKSKT